MLEYVLWIIYSRAMSQANGIHKQKPFSLARTQCLARTWLVLNPTNQIL